MSDQAIINLIGCLVWFFIGAAVLSATGRGLLDVTEAFSKDESIKNTTLPVLGIPGIAIVMIIGWLIGCLIWPRSLVRYFKGYGLINGHNHLDCPSREKVGEKRGMPRFRHGTACRKKEKG